jgi:hypothetical protein
MPSFINDNGYNGLGGLAQNYRRATTGGSNFGSRRIQFYQITLNGISNSEVAKLDNYRVVNNTGEDIDQEAEREFRTANFVEAILRGVQSNAELYIVGAHDVDSTETPDYNIIKLTIGVAGDTFSSGNEMENRDAPPDGPPNNNAYLEETIEDALNGYASEFGATFDGFSLRAVFIYGHSLDVIPGSDVV